MSPTRRMRLRPFALVSAVVLAAGACSASQPTTLKVGFVLSPLSAGLRSALCPKADAAYFVYFLPGSGAATIQSVLSSLEANPATGIVGYVDQAAGYQEFETIFSGDPAVRSSLSESQIPPSLRVIGPARDLARAESAVAGAPGILRVSSPPDRPGEPVSVGVLQFERASWRNTCRLGRWQGAPSPSPIPAPSPPAGTVPGHGIEVFDVAGANMEPSLRPGDKIDVILGKVPIRGQIAVIERPPASSGPRYVIDRVVGLPGETISASGGRVWIDGRPLAEPWLPSGSATGDFGPLGIPHSSYFVMGDNRGDSADSRVYGPVPAGSLAGVAFAVVYPPSRARSLS